MNILKYIRGMRYSGERIAPETLGIALTAGDGATCGDKHAKDEPVDQLVSVTLKRAECPNFSRSYTYKASSGTAIEITSRWLGYISETGPYYDGILTQTNGIMEHFCPNPHRPHYGLESIQDLALRQEVERVSRRAIEEDTAWRNPGPAEFTDAKGVTWRRVEPVANGAPLVADSTSVERAIISEAIWREMDRDIANAKRRARANKASDAPPKTEVKAMDSWSQFIADHCVAVATQAEDKPRFVRIYTYRSDTAGTIEISADNSCFTGRQYHGRLLPGDGCVVRFSTEKYFSDKYVTTMLGERLEPALLAEVKRVAGEIVAADIAWIKSGPPGFKDVDGVIWRRDQPATAADGQGQ